MKLLHYGLPQEERPGLLDRKGVVRDLSAHVSDISPHSAMPTDFGTSRLSEFMTLYAGDLLTTGTPPGVGMGQAAASISQGRR
jgi:ureidoglycolate lyase